MYRRCNIKRNLTIKDVAKKAGVSVATVSRVLNSSTSVRRETAKIVQDAINELEYIPNNIATNLKTDQSHVIAFVVTDVKNSVLTYLISSIQNVLWDHNYFMMFFATNGDPDRETSILRFIAQQRVDGIILNSCTNEKIVTKLSKQIPIVLTGNDITDPNFIGDFIDTDNHAATYMLTSHLISQGHRNIGIINGPHNLDVSYERFCGYQSALAVIGLNVIESSPLVYQGNFDRISGFNAAKSLLSLTENRPTALLITNNEMMKGVLQYCLENKINIPDDLSIVTIGNRCQLDLLYISPTYMETNLEEIGERLARLLLERIEKDHKIPKRILRVPAFFHNGTTVKPIV
ncbi:LacI family transcriptional regulator [Lacrimispora sp. NSJ-141]|uniref:LacI family transcriptional regulator n=1 Tax=Lientehia hominis TaxID=2897778 RepID=A0AAP2W888_9FIRM|nr:LacI family DNA-binding transcriptional regulator [Lientehia hominis]MCD2493228.1 LacI family transcriptional regulator [Lientehia hominis]